MPDGRFRPHYRPRRGFNHRAPIRFLPIAPIVGTLLIVAVLVLSTWGRVDHVVLVDLPIPLPLPKVTGEISPPNRIVLSGADQLYWNDEPVTPAKLSKRMLAARNAPHSRSLIFDADGRASYGAVAKTLNLVRQAEMLNRSFCFDGLERHRQYELPANQAGGLWERTTCQPSIVS